MRGLDHDLSHGHELSHGQSSHGCVSDAWIVCRLRTHVRNALKSVKFDCKRVYLELYAGAKVVTGALRKDGCAVIAFEIDDGPEFDLTRACASARHGLEPDEALLVPAGAPSEAMLAF